jgi:hypothetical protein
MDSVSKSNVPERQDRPGDLDNIRQLLRQLEEAAVRESETADATSTAVPVWATPGTLPPASEYEASENDDAGNDLASLTRGRGRAVSSPVQSLDSAVPAPHPTVTILHPSGPAPVPAPVPRRASRIAIALGSFALGIAAAGGILVGLAHLQLPRPAERAASPSAAVAVAVAVDVAPAAIAPEPATAPPDARAEITSPASPSAPAETTSPATSTIQSATNSQTPSRSEPTSASALPSAPAEIAAPSPAEAPATPASSIQPLADANATAASKPTATPAASAAPKAPTPLADNAERTLQVADRIELRAGQRVPFDLAISPATPETERLLIVLRSVPPWLSLSKGGAIGNAIWLLPAHEAAGVSLQITDQASAGPTEIIVQLAQIDGSILAERKVEVRVTGRAPLGTQTLVSSSSIEQAVMRQLQARGELLLDTGEVESARTLLRTAAEAGSVAAALRLAETYDPSEVQRLGVTAISADLAEAVHWYRRAEALGSPIAAARLLSLGRR